MKTSQSKSGSALTAPATLAAQHTMAADAELYGNARDEQADNVVRLAEVVVRGASDLVHNLLRTSVELSEHDAVPFLSAAGCIVRLVIQQAEAVGENNQYVHEAGRRARAVHVSSKTLRSFLARCLVGIP